MIDLLLTPARTNNGETVHSALAWFHGSIDGYQYFSHAGGAGGY